MADSTTTNESTEAPAEGTMMMQEVPADTADTGHQTMIIKNAEDAYNETMNTLYLSGFSFILGVLFTVLILLILDFMRRNASDQEK
ncbi:MAG: hypothetical protein U1E36_06505 [Rickettsiales bacterium]